MKKQSTLFLFPTEDEIRVSQILLDLPDLITTLQSPSFQCLKWSTKKRRSGLTRIPPSSLSHRKLFKIGARKDKDKANSPVTPLSFSSGESEENPQRGFERSSLKRTREEYDEVIDELTQRRDLLRLEIENVTKYYNKLNAHNSELKRAKQEVLKNSCLMKENPEVEMNLGMQLIQHHHQIPHPQPLVADQTAEQVGNSLGPITAQLFPLSNGLGPVNHVAGPFKIPDLNISADEANWMDPSQPLDMSIDRRSRFAEARRRRKGMMKIKSMRISCGIKLPAVR